MPVLPETVRSRLPPLYSQEEEADPIVYARLFLPGTSLNWYVLEGEMTEDAGLVLGCFFRGKEEESFGHFAEAFLAEFHGPNGEGISWDDHFIEGRLTDVVPALDL